MRRGFRRRFAERPPILVDNAFSLTGTVIITVISTISSQTQTLPPVTTTPSSVPEASSTSLTSQFSSTSTPEASQFTSTTQFTSISAPEASTPTPIASAVTTSTSNAADSSNLAGTRKISAGAIVGIVIGGFILILALLVVLLRNKFIRNREQRRATWANQTGVPSRAVTGITVSSFGPAEKFPEARSPGLSFALAQQQALAARGGIPKLTLPPNAATVKFTFNPTLPDELVIVNGEVLSILQEFDDGWALCQNNSRAQGMVPLECLDRGGQTPVQMGLAVGSARDVRNSKRVSSLLAALR